MKAETLAVALLDWFATEARDLPWRRTRDPYAIWVSEIMLQQTQVKTVIPYWERWMRELPDVAALASAAEARVLKLWEGLGYYRRVRHMQAAAKVVMARHGGCFPRDPAEVLALPGVGRYTAGAICSIAFDQPEPILDGNVIRVLARLEAMAGDPRERTGQQRLWQWAGELVRAAAASGRRNACSHLNQALMELGATVCLPRQARCDACPVAGECRARRAGAVEDYPEAKSRPEVTEREFVTVVVRAGGRYRVRQRPAGEVNGGLWEFPNVEVRPGRDEPEAMARRLVEDLPGLEFRRGTGDRARGPAVRPWKEVRHAITRYRMLQRVYRVEFEAVPNARTAAKAGAKARGTASGTGLDGAWHTLEELEALAFGAAHRRVVGWLRGEAARAAEDDRVGEG